MSNFQTFFAYDYNIKKFATTTEEIRRILRLVANFTGTGENKGAEGKI